MKRPRTPPQPTHPPPPTSPHPHPLPATPTPIPRFWELVLCYCAGYQEGPGCLSHQKGALSRNFFCCKCHPSRANCPWQHTQKALQELAPAAKFSDAIVKKLWLWWQVEAACLQSMTSPTEERSREELLRLVHKAFSSLVVARYVERVPPCTLAVPEDERHDGNGPASKRR